MSSNNILLSSVPTAKLTIGNKGSIEIDTASSQGKKTIKLLFTTDNDTVQKEIENVVDEIKSEIEDAKEEIQDAREEIYTASRSSDREEHFPHSGPNMPPFFVPVFLAFIVFAYLAYKSYQDRKWKETLLNKGFNPEEIESKNQVVSEGGMDGIKNFEQAKHLKYAIVFCSLGLAILLGSIMDGAGYFFGTLAFCLGGGFFYFYKKGL